LAALALVGWKLWHDPSRVKVTAPVSKPVRVAPVAPLIEPANPPVVVINPPVMATNPPGMAANPPAQKPSLPVWNVSPLAGQVGVGGYVDGVGTQAQFRLPKSVATDLAGNLYVADTANNTIRKITPEGVVSTLAGDFANHGSTDGPGGTNDIARFSAPFGLAVDRLGTVYVADMANNLIRQITPDGVVSTLAGLAETPGGKDGPGSNASFRNPWAVAVDNQGCVFVADMSNDTIRKITPAGVVSTLAGQTLVPGSADGAGSQAQFNSPRGVAVDNAGNVYVSDSANNAIRKITTSGVVSTLAGLPGYPGSMDGRGDNARFWNPQGLVVDDNGNLLVADTDNNAIRKITPDGLVTTLAGPTTVAGGDTNNAGEAVHFNSPGGVAVDHAGNIYVADTASHVIRKMVFAPPP
jgi:sugar lactone lactonase YvrE